MSAAIKYTKRMFLSLAHPASTFIIGSAVGAITTYVFCTKCPIGPCCDTTKCCPNNENNENNGQCPCSCEQCTCNPHSNDHIDTYAYDS